MSDEAPRHLPAGEKIASDFLTRRGYHILKTNYRCPYVEVEITARHQDYLVFIEVRTKRSLKFGSPEESITPANRERIIANAWHYQQSRDKPPSLWRIDVVDTISPFPNGIMPSMAILLLSTNTFMSNNLGVKSRMDREMDNGQVDLCLDTLIAVTKIAHTNQ